MRILIAQSDSALATFLRKSLEAEGYWTEAINELSLILPRLMEAHYQLVILDTDGLGCDGVPEQQAARSVPEWIRTLCAGASSSALLVISSQAAVEQRVAALDAGADDVMAKPFSYFELAARIRVLLRRTHISADTKLQAGELTLDRIARTVSRDGHAIELTSREFRLLEFLMRNYGLQVSRDAILQHVWADVNTDGAAAATHADSAEEGSSRNIHNMTNIVDVYINYLRQKLSDSREKRLIHTVRGIGYRLGSAAQAEPAIEPEPAMVRAC